jgi:hypothetical protein
MDAPEVGITRISGRVVSARGETRQPRRGYCCKTAFQDGSSVEGHRLINSSVREYRHPSDQAGFIPKRESWNASPFFKIEARLLGERVRFFAPVATGTRCAQPTMVTRTQSCRRDLPRESWRPGCKFVSIPPMMQRPRRHLARRSVLQRVPGTHG